MSQSLVSWCPRDDLTPLRLTLLAFIDVMAMPACLWTAEEIKTKVSDGKELKREKEEKRHFIFGRLFVSFSFCFPQKCSISALSWSTVGSQ